MSASPRILSLDLGSQTLGLAEFQAQPNGGLVLTGYRRREILADPAAETDRNRQISETLSAMMRELGIKNGPIDYAVSGQSVFARFVKLPSVDQDKIERIVTFEAQQNVPFPIEEVVWDYQLVGSSEADKIEVVLVAIKADLLDGINAAVEAAGLQTRRVDVAPMALYNAFRFNYSELTGSSLVIYIGARTTNLLFIEPGKVFSRSIPIGGSSITAAIAKEFNEPFGAAELRKKHDGFVSLGGADAEASDPDVARVSKLVRSTMTRLHAELTRSISFYRTQQQGSRPERVFLCGGTASTPYMREFFHEKLQWPVEFFNPLRNVVVGESVAIEERRGLRPFVRRTGRARASQHHDVSDGVESATGQCRPPAATRATSSVPAAGRRLSRARSARLGLLFSACDAGRSAGGRYVAGGGRPDARIGKPDRQLAQGNRRARRGDDALAQRDQRPRCLVAHPG